jgi:hypothetical protein
MARGYPDFFGSSIFPGYGVPLSLVSMAIPIAAGATVAVVDLALKGSTGHGFIYLDDLVTIADVTVQATIDGYAHFILGLDNLYNILAPHERQSLVSLTYLNRESQHATLSICPGIPFGQSFKVEITNGLATDITANVELLYFSVE